jgi:membrane associated rhomboid family serine protease
MPISTRPWARGTSYYGSYFPLAVKWLLISNIALFVLYYFAVLAGFAQIFHPFGLIPYDVLHGRIWQLVTYLFLHDPTGFTHILFNMLTLWFFGVSLEQTWGWRRFLKFYFLCGIGAGLCVVFGNLLFAALTSGDAPVFSSEYLLSRTIGASGAIYGVLLAFGMLFPDTEILFMFLFPLKAKYFVMIMGAIAFMLTLTPGGTVSNVAHLGGMLFGYVYLKSARARSRSSFNIPIGQWYRDYKLRRAKKKFQVYLKKKQSDQDRWVH